MLTKHTKFLWENKKKTKIKLKKEMIQIENIIREKKRWYF